jgi:hypothetical protein
MEQMTVAKAIAAVLAGLATIASTVFAVNVDWLSPELTVTIGTAIGALLVYLVPNEPVDPEV